jgi:uncharacterized protein YfiM (DUF2279 family)
MLARLSFLAAIVVLVCPTSLGAETRFVLMPAESDPSPPPASPCPGFSLLQGDDPHPCSVAQLDEAGIGGGGSDIAESGPSPVWLQYRAPIASAVALGVVTGSAFHAFSETPHKSFHFTNEGFFGEDTYAGGADKASHFVDFAVLSKELGYFYERIGFSRGESILLGFGVATAAGLTVEIGDGTNVYGFSWEDLVMDTAGAGTAAVIAAVGLQDVVGFRHGWLVPPAGDRYCCAVEGPGRDYSNEIFTADVHLAGLARRLEWNIGPLRYLLVSATYGVKGYPSGASDSRERQVGIEIGLNLEVILNDLGVTRQTWWGYGIHVVLDNVRVPFLAVGFRYDLNHHRWIGPDNGNGFATR